jgi:hypothetical protein
MHSKNNASMYGFSSALANAKAESQVMGRIISIKIGRAEAALKYY